MYEREVSTMKRQLMLLFLVGLLAAAMASCTSAGTWGTTNPPIVKVKVFNYLESAQAGTVSEIYFSVTNVTDQELRDLTLDGDIKPDQVRRASVYGNEDRPDRAERDVDATADVHDQE